jgi:hypothetical protein
LSPRAPLGDARASEDGVNPCAQHAAVRPRRSAFSPLTFEGPTLRDAIHATFERRRTTIPTKPTAFTATFFEDAAKVRQWRAFTQKIRGGEGMTLKNVVASLSKFLLPPLQAAGASVPFDRRWSPEGGWGVAV